MREDLDIGRPLPFAHYDRRGYRAVSVEEGYADWSRIYTDFDRRFDLDLLDRSPLLRQGLSEAAVVDLGCGTGRIGQWLRERGAASVIGVDRSAEMLDGARKRGCYAELIQADMVDVDGLEGGSVDGVISSMAVCHVEQLERLYQQARYLLRSEGWVCLVDYHPFLLMKGIPSHFRHPDTDEQVAVHNHVHGLSDHFRSAREAGLELVELEERYVTGEWVEAKASYAKLLGWPITFLVAFRATR